MGTTAILGLLIVASCAVDTGAIAGDTGAADTTALGETGAPPDSALDARPRDTSPAGDTGVVEDSGALDGAPADAADTGPVDTGPVDTAPPDTGPPPSCDSLYGAVGGYYRCNENTDSCEFYTNPSGNQSCDAVCASGGGTCLDAWRESGLCGHESDRDCSFPMNDMICLCSR